MILPEDPAVRLELFFEAIRRTVLRLLMTSHHRRRGRRHQAGRLSEVCCRLATRLGDPDSARHAFRTVGVHPTRSCEAIAVRAPHAAVTRLTAPASSDDAVFHLEWPTMPSHGGRERGTIRVGVADTGGRGGSVCLMGRSVPGSTRSRIS